MAHTVNIYEAKTSFSRLVARVLQGEEIVIARGGRPVARLVPIKPQVKRRTPGSARGMIRVGEDFDAPLPEEAVAAFEE